MAKKSIFIAQLLLVFIWLAVSCTAGLVVCLFRWGNLNNDRFFGQLFSRVGVRILGYEIELSGGEHFESHQPCIYVSNHQSMLEVLIFGAIYPHRTILIGKKELIWIPFFGLFYVASGNLLIDRKKRTQAVGGLKRAVAAVKEKSASVWIYPEGTRNRSENPLLPFKKGGFYMAIQAQVPVVPIVCESIRKRIDFKRMKVVPGKIRIHVLSPIPTQGMTDANVESLLHQARERMLEEFKVLSA